eukprot:3412778-Rhodomonas_salina.1
MNLIPMPVSEDFSPCARTTVTIFWIWKGAARRFLLEDAERLARKGRNSCARAVRCKANLGMARAHRSRTAFLESDWAREHARGRLDRDRLRWRSGWSTKSTVPTLNGSVKSHAVQLAMNSSHVIVVRELVRPLALKEMAAVICAGAN